MARKLQLTVDMDNAAFDAHAELELARIMRELAEWSEYAWLGDSVSMPVFDINGNKVGTWSFQH